MIAWDDAVALASRMVPPGPAASRTELDDLVAGLRRAAADAVPHVLATTGMTPAAAMPDGWTLFSPVYVVDRVRWIRANAHVMEAMTGGFDTAFDAAQQEHPDRIHPMPHSAQVAGAVEVGALLALLSKRVLGQFDPYAPDGGRLLLVAPNILASERLMEVNPADYRLWVCLHEQTHALQFAAAPWLADHLRGKVTALTESLARAQFDRAAAPTWDRLVDAATTVKSLIESVATTDGPPLFERVMTAEQKEELANITAVMALLEGHADVHMDAVGPSVVPTVATIRRRFTQRREARPRVDALLRRLMGMDAKLAQYRDGAAFIRAVETQVGRDGLNAIWQSPDTLPTAADIANPAAWVARIHG
jgi:coenzyme F420 biosynthesis associated uncharacterized protein